MSLKPQPSGSMKRKHKKDKETREAQLLKKLPTISSFFKNANTVDANNNVSAASSEDGASTTNRDRSDTESPACDYFNPPALRLPAPPSPPPPSPPPPSPPPPSQCQDDQTKSKTDDDDHLFWETNNDPALWGDIKRDSVKSILINRGAAAFHNRSSKYTSSVRDSGLGGKTRSLTNDLLNTRLPNGQIVSREWLLYSPSTGQVFCYSCKLFSSKRHAFTDGFSDWKHPERISEHERSPGHMSCMLALLHRSKNTQAIDSALVKQIAGEREYWKEVLKRVVAVIKFLAERGLAFRGEDELLEECFKCDRCMSVL
nr:zinc finger MYM-type protein 5-like [Misgurnus anguillicaudatus]